jgi:hypothetical protein
VTGSDLLVKPVVKKMRRYGNSAFHAISSNYGWLAHENPTLGAYPTPMTIHYCYDTTFPSVLITFSQRYCITFLQAIVTFQRVEQGMNPEIQYFEVHEHRNKGNKK